MLKYVIMSDTHGLINLDVPKGDVLIHAGDFTNIGEINDTSRFLNWFGNLPHKHKILIAGNHDFLPQENYYLFLDMVREHKTIFYLQDSLVEIEGLKIYGSPWTKMFLDWAFMKSDENLKKIWDLIPDNIDILVTHQPPFGILDEVEKYGHLGCEHLLKVLDRIKPKIHMFGHVHNHFGRVEKFGINFINATLLNEQYKIINKPVEIEI